MYLFNSIVLILLAAKGMSKFIDELEDGIERTRTFNIEMISDYIKIGYNLNPGKNNALSATLLNYQVGTLAIYTKRDKVAEALVKSLNYKSQIKKTIAFLTPTFLSFDDTESLWAGTFFADVSQVFERNFIDDYRKIFNSNVRNTDFKDRKFAADVINQEANVLSVGYGTSGDIISPDMIDHDGRFIILVTNFLEGGFIGCVTSCVTDLRDFYLTTGEKVQVPTMRILGIHGYGKIKKYDATVLQLYFQGGDFTMKIVMPKSCDDIPVIVKELGNTDYYDETFSQLDHKELEVYMPYIEIHKNFDLTSYYEKQGNEIDLESISFNDIFKHSHDAYVSQILADIHIRINEGQSSANNTESISKSKKSVTVCIDRPIIYYICSKFDIPMIGGIYTGVN